MKASVRTLDHDMLLQLKRSIVAKQQDMTFLQECFKKKLIPNDHRLQIEIKIADFRARRIHLRLITENIREHHQELNKLYSECYALHLKLAKEYPEGFSLFLGEVELVEKGEVKRKRKILEKKLNALQQEKKQCNTKTRAMLKLQRRERESNLTKPQITDIEARTNFIENPV